MVSLKVPFLHNKKKKKKKKKKDEIILIYIIPRRASRTNKTKIITMKI